jgi:hypothetical protein
MVYWTNNGHSTNSCRVEINPGPLDLREVTDMLQFRKKMEERARVLKEI